MSDEWLKVETQLPGVDLAREARAALTQQFTKIRDLAGAAALTAAQAPTGEQAARDALEDALVYIEDVRAQAALSMAILEACAGKEVLVRAVPGAVEFDPWFRSVHLQDRTVELLAEVHRDRRSSLVPRD
jgi:hypothetical protein